jgi:hypothetical protein
LGWLSARPRPHNYAGSQKGQETGSRKAPISQAGLEISVPAVEDTLEISTLRTSYIDIYVFKFFVALIFFLCFIQLKFVLFGRTIAL